LEVKRKVSSAVEVDLVDKRRERTYNAIDLRRRREMEEFDQREECVYKPIRYVTPQPCWNFLFISWVNSFLPLPNERVLHYLILKILLGFHLQSKFFDLPWLHFINW
jgi:hypothetical protein